MAKFEALRRQLELEINTPVTVTVHPFGCTEQTLKSVYEVEQSRVVVYSSRDGYTELEGMYPNKEAMLTKIHLLRARDFYSEVVPDGTTGRYIGKCPQCNSFGLDTGTPNYIDMGMCRRLACNHTSEPYVTKDGKKGVMVTPRTPSSKWEGLMISNDGDVYTSTNFHVGVWDVKAKWRYVMG